MHSTFLDKKIIKLVSAGNATIKLENIIIKIPDSLFLFISYTIYM